MTHAKFKINKPNRCFHCGSTCITRTGAINFRCTVCGKVL